MGNSISSFTSASSCQPNRQDQFTQHLEKLSIVDTKRLILSLLELNPTARAKCILLNTTNSGNEESSSGLTDKDVENLYKAVESAICECRAEEIYLDAFIE